MATGSLEGIDVDGRIVASRTGALIVAATTVACLVLFLNKPFHMDDPLFLWAAQQIQQKPLDFYGFKVFWYVQPMPMWEVMQNPPLTSYYLAVVASLLGWSEAALHGAMLLPAMLAIVGTHRLASRLGADPLPAALVTLFTPAFLVSSTNLMADSLLVAFWIWSINLWLIGVDRESWTRTCAASLLIAAATMTKYFGVALIPLLLVHTLMRGDRRARFVVALIIPISLIAGYEVWTRSLYGQGLFLGSSKYADQSRELLGVSTATQAIAVLSFLGGVAVSVLFLAPRLWSPVVLGGALLSAGIFAQIAHFLPGLFNADFDSQHPKSWIAFAHLGFFAAGGLLLLATAARDLWQNRSADAVLIFLWIFGAVFFSAFVNWTVNARSLLPAVPALAITAFRWSSLRDVRTPLARTALWLGLAAAAAVSLAAAWGDASFAHAARNAATLAQQSADAKGIRSDGRWYQGHWGFQWYVEKLGWRPLEFPNPNPQAGDWVAMQFPNTNIVALNPQAVGPTEQTKIPVFSWPATIDVRSGAAFYSSQLGPLPYLFERRFAVSLDLVPIQ